MNRIVLAGLAFIVVAVVAPSLSGVLAQGALGPKARAAGASGPGWCWPPPRSRITPR